MTFIRLSLLFLSLIGIFISGGIYFRKKDLKHRSLSLIVLFLSIEYLNFLYGTSEFAQIFPHFIGIVFFPIGFLYGPLLMIHIKSVLEIKSRLTFLHFLPFFIITISLWDLFTIEGGLARGQFIKDNFFYRFLYYNYLRAFHITSYGIGMMFVFVRRMNQVRQSDRIYSMGINVIYFVSGIVVSLLTEFATAYRDFVWYYLISSSISVFIGYLLYIDAPFLKTIRKYIASSLSEEEMKAIASKVDTTLKDDEVYLERDFSLSKLADLIEESSHKISQTLSVIKGKNFNDYINQYRIEHAKKLLLDPKHDHYKIEAIAIDSGFNNKVTFYKAFSKENGTTPNAFRNQVKSSK